MIIRCLSRRASEALLRRSCSESWLSHWRTALSLWRRTFLADGLIQCRRRFEEGPEGFLRRSGSRWACVVAPWACRSCRHFHASWSPSAAVRCRPAPLHLALPLPRRGACATVSFRLRQPHRCRCTSRRTPGCRSRSRPQASTACRTHDSAVQVGLAGLATVKAARYRLVAQQMHTL